jgi:hypothetical protein
VTYFSKVTWTSYKLDLDIIEINIRTKFEEDRTKIKTARVRASYFYYLTLRRNKEFIRDIFSHTNMPYAGLTWNKIKKKSLSVYAMPTSHFTSQIRWSKSILITVVYLSDCAETLHFCPQTDSIYNFYKILFQIWRLVKMVYYFHFHI